MTIEEIIKAIELLAPLSRKEEYDNPGLQAGDRTDRECTGVLLCLDVTEDIVDEAIAKGCNMIVSHHPLIYRPLCQVSDKTYQQRCVARALRNGLVIYSSHTNLDNSENGVNWKISELLGIKNPEWLIPKESGDAGTGAIGFLEHPVSEEEFLARVKNTMEVTSLRHSPLLGKQIRKVAVVGGSGAPFVDAAQKAGADCYITGELHYHDYFGLGMVAVAIGHYESEHFTRELLRDYLASCTDARLVMTEINTNAVNYL